MSSRDEIEREVDARLARVQERVDRLLAFRTPVDRDLEQRVQDIERLVHVLMSQLSLLLVRAADNKMKALEELEAMLDRAEAGESSSGPFRA